MSLFGREAAGRRHIDGLDVLRTLAIVGVTLFHMFPERLPGGYLGVSLFFVLTGFLLAYTSKRSWLEHRFRVKTYYMKRIKRIYPSLFIVLLTTIGVCSFVLPKAVTAIRPEFLSIVLGYNNWWQIAQNADYFTRLTNASPFTHLWFMGIEMQYYLVWPLLFALYAFLDILAGRRAALAVLALLALGSAAVMPMMYEPDMDVTRLYYGTDTRAYALLFGAVLGLWWVDHPRAHLGKYRMLLGYLAWPVLVGASIAAYFLFDGQSAYVYEWGMLAMTVLFCVLLLLTADDRFFVGAALESPGLRWLGWLGKRSFGIYLWQYPVIYLFAKLGWTQLPYYAALEIAAILVLTIWSDALAHVITSRRLPAIRGRHIVTACIFLTAFTLPGLALMGFGGHAIAVSADQKVSDTGELQERLAANAAEQQAANDQAAAEAAEQKAAKDEAAVDLSGVACIGDSVMLGSSGELRKVLPGCNLDAEVSRYVGGGLDAAKEMAAQGRLGKNIVIALGTNGPIAGYEKYEVQTRALLEYLGPDRHIFWVNVYCPELSWQQTNNDYLVSMAKDHPNVTIVDWYGLVSKHPEWLGGDGIHPNDEGTAAYAKLIHDTMAETLAHPATD
ncbi:acyltransferase family protein [Mitsuokella jalaludinii]|uniref:acyltransferase family protein n=1 Tax=Mitsuokella jalaludinii TaxID=187979 RepID=UPI003AF8926C